MSRSVQLLARADDAGLNAGTNEGVRRAAAHGIARNLSVLGIGPALEDAAQRLLGLDVCFGFHACLNSEWLEPCWAPLSGDARLMDARGMLPPDGDTLRLLNPPACAVEAELSAQLRRLREHGFAPVYMDEHMFFSHAMPALKPMLVEFARREGLVYRMELPCLPTLATDSDDAVNRVLRRLAAAASGTWLEIVHPAIDSADMRIVRKKGQPAGAVATARAGDLGVFTDQNVIEACATENTRLLRYDELAVEIIFL
jgi:chitin disaccharide deacetylase